MHMIINRPSTRFFAKSFLVLLLTLPGILLLRPMNSGAARDQTPADRAKQPDQHLAPVTTGLLSELGARIDKAIDDSNFANARWGIYVISLTDGSVVYQRNGDKLFTPASNMKIYTTSVALDLLGPDYRWRTSVYANAAPDTSGRVAGDLVLYGRGAPDLVARSKDESRGSLEKLAADLYARGVRSIDGDVVGDESYFRGDPLGDGWQWTDLQWYFAAEASALSVNGNEVDINFVPAGGTGGTGEVRTTDTEGYVTVENRMAAGKSGAQPTVGVHRGLSDNNVEVWGEFAPGSKGFGARLSVHNPAAWAAKLFTGALKAQGITVGGQPTARSFRMPRSQRFEPTQAVELAAVNSQPLSEIAKKTNKESNNLYAELILRTLGRARSQASSGAETGGRERGDDEAGLGEIRFWLERAGIPTNRLALHDGSGLSRLDLVTPETSARVLQAIARKNSAGVFKDSLPIAGRDGTLGGRLSDIVDRVFAKTGSLTYDNSLSGYLMAANGQVLAFSIMCNDQTGRGNSIRLIDQIVGLLAASPAEAREKPQKPH